MKKIKESGFTLIEVLVVIMIIATLSTVVYVALNPAGRLQDARNARRFNDVNSILTAVHEYVVDNKGMLPAGVGLTEATLGTATSGCNATCTGAATACVDLSTDLAKYLKSMPMDPLNGTATVTNYSVVRDANGIVTVKACDAEAGQTVQVSR